MRIMRTKIFVLDVLHLKCQHPWGGAHQEAGDSERAFRRGVGPEIDLNLTFLTAREIIPVIKQWFSEQQHQYLQGLY